MQSKPKYKQKFRVPSPLDLDFVTIQLLYCIFVKTFPFKLRLQQLLVLSHLLLRKNFFASRYQFLLENQGSDKQSQGTVSISTKEENIQTEHTAKQLFPERDYLRALF